MHFTVASCGLLAWSRLTFDLKHLRDRRFLEFWLDILDEDLNMCFVASGDTSLNAMDFTKVPQGMKDHSRMHFRYP